LKISNIISASFLSTNWIIMVILFCFDLFSKIWVRENLPLHETRKIVTNYLDLLHVQNRGISFSFFSDLSESIRVPFLVGVSLVAVIAMLYYQNRYWKELDFFTRSGLVCVLPGAAGNLVDRSFFGYVTDFLHFRWHNTSFFVNNLADCFISIGVVFFIIPLIFSKKNYPPKK